jgi:hypothetical protein
MSLLEWARRNGISRATAYRRHNDGTLPVATRRTPTGRIVVDIPPEDCQGACLTDIHLACVTDAVITELTRRGYRLDQAHQPGPQ